MEFQISNNNIIKKCVQNQYLRYIYSNENATYPHIMKKQKNNFTLKMFEMCE